MVSTTARIDHRALADGSGVVEILNLVLGERAAVDRDFIEQSKIGPRAVAGWSSAKKKIVAGLWLKGPEITLSNDTAIAIEPSQPGSFVVSHGDMLPDACDHGSGRGVDEVGISVRILQIGKETSCAKP